MNCCPKEGFYVGRCYYDYRRICGHCGGEFGSDHCKHDGVQRRSHCCGWLDEGKQTPLQFLGWASE